VHPVAAHHPTRGDALDPRLAAPKLELHRVCAVAQCDELGPPLDLGAERTQVLAQEPLGLALRDEQQVRMPAG
jgi:hypothetical protein